MAGPMERELQAPFCCRGAPVQSTISLHFKWLDYFLLIVEYLIGYGADPFRGVSVCEANDSLRESFAASGSAAAPVISRLSALRNASNTCVKRHFLTLIPLKWLSRGQKCTL